jgi:predicted extracellular nuclease
MAPTNHNSLTTLASISAGSDLVLNEVYASHTGTDDTEFVELFGTPGYSLDGLSFIAVEGDAFGPGTIDARLDFDSSQVIGDNGFFLIGNPTGLNNNYGVTPNLDIANNFLENSSATYALVETSSITNSSVSGSEVVLDAVALTDGDSADTFFFDAPVIGPDGTFFPAGARRVTDGVDTDSASDWVISDFSLGNDNTPTAGTGEQPPPPSSLTAIYDVQGSGASSPIVGQTVTIEGIVTGDFQDGDADTSRSLRGFYVQEETGDGDASTSDGVFVFESSLTADVNVGDKVRITGTVAEFFGETQISASSVAVVGSGTIAPTSVSLPTIDTVTNRDGELLADLEQYEGMLVEFSDELTITEMFNLDRFGEIRAAQGGRLFQFTNNNEPDVAAFNDHLKDIASRTITIDDGLTVQNPDPITLPDGNDLTSSTIFRMGDTLTDLVGNIRFSRGSGGSGDETYRLMPTEDATLTQGNPRPTGVPDVGGDIKVASFNVLNFFTTLDGAGFSGPNDLPPRGADNQAEYDRQIEKLVNALEELDADIIGLQELENNGFGPNSAIATLVDAVNDTVGAGTYNFVDTGTSFVDAGDAITVGFIYKPSSVELADGTTVEVLTDADLAGLGLGSLPPVFDGPNTNRAPIAATFESLETGGTVTVAVNHFKSKGGSGSGADADAGDGAGAYNATRVNAAIALSEWLKSDPTVSGDKDFLLIGDFNSYQQEDPIDQLEATFDNLFEVFNLIDPYSFVFDGQAGSLDGAFSSSSLTGQVTGVGEWHINADEADAIDYNLDFGRPGSIFDASNEFRVSDHDPLVIGLSLEPKLDTVTVSVNDGNEPMLTIDRDGATSTLDIDQNRPSIDVAGLLTISADAVGSNPARLWIQDGKIGVNELGGDRGKALREGIDDGESLIIDPGDLVEFDGATIQINLGTAADSDISVSFDPADAGASATVSDTAPGEAEITIEGEVTGPFGIAVGGGAQAVSITEISFLSEPETFWA